MRNGQFDEIIQKHLVPADQYLYGFADLSGLVEAEFGDFSYGISIARKLDFSIVDSIVDGPNLEYYYHYAEVNSELTIVSSNIAADLKKAGFSAISLEPTVTTGQLDTLYSENLRTRLSHKMVSTRAGMGWIGKTDLLVTREFGPRIRLVTILTDTPLVPSADPVEVSQCGNCNICVEVCPAEAATGEEWNTKIDRDSFFNPFKCRETCRKLGEEVLKVNVRICGMCVANCPYGRDQV